MKKNLQPTAKPLGYKAYGSIPHLSKSRLGVKEHYIDTGQEMICTKKVRDWKDLIIVQEKIDGANCAVVKHNGKIFALQRKGYLAESSPYLQHHYFAKWVNKNIDRFNLLLNDDERVIGEWILQAHGTRYELKHEPFVPFDIMKEHNRICYHDFQLRILPLGFTIPRLIHIGQPFSIERLEKKLEPSGHGALDPVEGAVYRVERDGKFDFICKYVRHDKVDGKYLPENNNGIIVWNTNPDLV